MNALSIADGAEIDCNRRGASVAFIFNYLVPGIVQEFLTRIQPWGEAPVQAMGNSNSDFDGCRMHYHIDVMIQTSHEPTLLVHGGAWAIPQDAAAAHEAGVRNAL